MALAAAVEFYSVYNGGSLAIELAFLAIPLSVALIFYRTTRSRLLAWLLLTVVSYTTAAITMLSYLFGYWG
jgi:hypothetical protein